MKILMVSDFYPPFIGGSYRHVQTLSRGLVKRGHEVVVCTIGNKYLNVFEDDYGVKVIRFEGFFQKIPFLFKNREIKHPPPVHDLLISKKLKDIITDEKPDIMHSHGWLFYSILPLNGKLDLPLVVTLHDYGFICPKITFFKGNQVCDEPFTSKCITCARGDLGLIKSSSAYYGIKSERNKLRLVDKFISVSSFVKEVYSKHLGLRKKIVVIPNFYEMEKENLKSQEAEAFPDDFILFVGGLSPHKGVDVLINAYNRLNTETRLVLIGGTYPDYSYESTENTMTIGNARYETVMEAYSKSRFVIIPSIWPDPCPTVAFEAMSYKKAIIASNTGGLSEVIVNGKTGILIPSNNSKKLAETIRYLLKNPSVANEMGKNGFNRFIRNYTSGAVVPKIEKVYDNLCSKARKKHK